MPRFIIKVPNDDEGEELGVYESDYLPRVGDPFALWHPRVCAKKDEPFLGISFQSDYVIRTWRYSAFASSSFVRMDAPRLPHTTGRTSPSLRHAHAMMGKVLPPDPSLLGSHTCQPMAPISDHFTWFRRFVFVMVLPFFRATLRDAARAPVAGMQAAPEVGDLVATTGSAHSSHRFRPQPARICRASRN
jgi:hypothetical protein